MGAGEKFGCLIRTTYNADLLEHQNNIQVETVYRGLDSDLRSV